MRFLCLHGMGTSGAIFRAQTSAFRDLLEDSKHTFDFIDAPHESGCGNGVETFYPPPYYTFWESIDPGDIAETHRWLRGVLASKEQPYDAVMCFSQGCAVIASLIISHNNEFPEEPLPFKGAVFICGGMPLAMLDNMYLPVSTKAWKINDFTGSQLKSKASAAAQKIESLRNSADGKDALRRGLWDCTDDLIHEVPLQGTADCHVLPKLEPTDVYGLDVTRFPHALKIDIPTVHVYGIKDPRYPASIQLAHLSDDKKRFVFDHGGGHEIPRTTTVSRELANAINWLDRQTCDGYK